MDDVISMDKISDLARWRWEEILPACGVSRNFLNKKHGPCPVCGGKDRYRFINGNGSGNYFCNQCTPQAGYGLKLIMKVNGWTWAEAVYQVARFLDCSPKNTRSYKLKDKKDPSKFIEEVLVDCKAVTKGDEVGRYLNSRGLDEIPVTIMINEKLYESENKTTCTGMVAKIQSASGKVISLHRTFIKDGCKAPIESPRKVMASIGKIAGGAIRLYPATNIVGIAEGIETALACHEMSATGLPVWAVMNTNGMQSFNPPRGIKTIIVLGDNDKNFAGQKAAYCVANRLAIDGYEVKVKIPDTPGNDWRDELMEKKK